MYFKTLPNIVYPFKESSTSKTAKTKVVKDIFRRIQLDKYITNRQNLEAYFVRGGETPEIVAHKLYGNSKYHFILLILNNIIDPRKEWPKGNRELTLYVKQKYGDNNMSDVHHYVEATDTDIIVDWDSTRLQNGEIQAVTNMGYEEELNEQKKQIFILPSSQIKDFVDQYKKLVG